jgi:hypothetical protein
MVLLLALLVTPCQVSDAYLIRCAAQSQLPNYAIIEAVSYTGHSSFIRPPGSDRVPHLDNVDVDINQYSPNGHLRLPGSATDFAILVYALNHTSD